MKHINMHTTDYAPLYRVRHDARKAMWASYGLMLEQQALMQKMHHETLSMITDIEEKRLKGAYAGDVVDFPKNGGRS